MQIADIAEDAIAVNELLPRDNTDGGYVLIGIGADESGNFYPARIMITEYVIQEIISLDKIYAVRAKKDSQSPYGAGFSQKRVPLYKGYPNIIIAGFLGVVKKNFADSLPSKYKMHKILLPDGSVFELPDNKKTVATTMGRLTIMLTVAHPSLLFLLILYSKIKRLSSPLT
ncbi:MAG: hypothetical protein J6N52_12545 [Clostridia bacterium]|nr:hypothetical protein [Clostridia bacterium]